jgi:lambda family phage portal protein
MSLGDRFRAFLNPPKVSRETSAPVRRNFYAAAAANRLTAGLVTSISSGAQEVRSDLLRLRARSRQLCRDNPNARRWLQLVQDNVVGHCGLQMQAQSRNARGDLNDTVNDAIEDAFEKWGHPDSCTVTGQLSWTGLQALIMRTWARDGEFFGRLVSGFPNRFGFAVQVLDADLCDETYDRILPDGEIRSGVETDEWGRPRAYWFWTRHPMDTTYAPMARQSFRQRIPASEILHVFRPERMGQTRGIPSLAPVLLQMDMADGYTEAELTAARTAAAKMGFITQGPDAEGPDPNAGTDPDEMQAAPGLIDRLGPGEGFQEWDPSHPSGNFGPFLSAVMHQIASGLGITHASLTGDLSQVNYSSARVGLLAERDMWRGMQTWFAEHVCDRIYRTWFRTAVLSPELTLPSPDLSRYDDVVWQGRGWPWVDPEKDMNAAEKALELRLTTRTQIAAEQGTDFAEILEQTTQDEALAEAAGVDLREAATPGSTKTTQTAAGAPDSNAPDGETSTDSAAPTPPARHLMRVRSL